MNRSLSAEVKKIRTLGKSFSGGDNKEKGTMAHYATMVGGGGGGVCGGGGGDQSPS